MTTCAGKRLSQKNCCERHASPIRLRNGGRCPPPAFVQKALSIPSDAPGWLLIWLFRLQGRSAHLKRFVDSGRHGLQHVAIDLAQRIAGQFIDDPKALWDVLISTAGL